MAEGLAAGLPGRDDRARGFLLSCRGTGLNAGESPVDSGDDGLEFSRTNARRGNTVSAGPRRPPPDAVAPALRHVYHPSAVVLDGAWRSPVARLLWEQDVGGSNPLAPIPWPARPGLHSSRTPAPVAQMDRAT